MPLRLPPVPRFACAPVRSGVRFLNTAAAEPIRKPTHRLRNLGVVVGLGTLGFLADRTFNAEALARTARTGFYGGLMAIDFKLNFNPERSESIDALHERVAWRIHHICVTNGGLYIKLAQSIALQATILPKPYRDAFASIFDQAPQVSFNEVVGVFQSEFGVHPDVAFDEFSRVAIASASIAQVHRARLKVQPGEPQWKEGEGYVAVKVRKPSVPKQLELDLFAYRTLLYCYEKLFDLPVAFVASYVSEQMRKEVDLAHEGKNAEIMAQHIAAEPSLRDKVFVPKVYWDWTGTSVMTADFVTACKLTDKDALTEQRLSFRETMDTATALFAAMTFKFGFIHCDPHPGNLLVRKNPDPKYASHPQIVLIDHGLCIPLDPSFRHDYSLLWRSLFVGDIAEIERIGQSWGIAKDNSDMLASATLLRPHRLRKKITADATASQTTYEQQTGLKDRLRAMLENEKLIPRELIFLARSMRMMQANNQSLGSPSNRINILAHWAVTGLASSPASLLASPTSLSLRHPSSIRPFLWEKTQLLIFRVALFAIDVGFLITQVRQWVIERTRRGDGKGEGFEDILQRQVANMAREEFGVELDDAAFQG